MKTSLKLLLASFALFAPSLYILFPIMTNPIVLFAVIGFAIGTVVFAEACVLAESEKVNPHGDVESNEVSSK